MVLNRSRGTFIKVDSIQSLRELALVIRDSDSSYILFNNERSILINRNINVNSIQYRDRQGKIKARYLLKSYGDTKEIYNREGELMFESNFDRIDLLQILSLELR